MSPLEIVAEEYAFVLTSHYPREQRAVRLQMFSDGTLCVQDWSDENDLFDSGSELCFTKHDIETLRRVLGHGAQ